MNYIYINNLLLYAHACTVHYAREASQQPKGEIVNALHENYNHLLQQPQMYSFCFHIVKVLLRKLVASHPGNYVHAGAVRA